MLRRLHRIDASKLELAIMLALASLSFIGIGEPIYVIGGGAILLTLSTIHEYAHLQPRFTRVGAERLMTAGIFSAAAISLAFAGLSFAVGRFFAWLIGA
jgi:hypothetical protein